MVERHNEGMEKMALEDDTDKSAKLTGIFWRGETSTQQLATGKERDDG